MARQQSSSELAGSLAATLTPSVPHVSAQRFRANQNSGLFDMGALYAETLDDVLRRTRTNARLAPLARASREPSATPHARPAQSLGPGAQPFGRPALPFARSAEPAWPLATRAPQPAPWIDVQAEAVPIEFIDFAAAPRPRGLGWYGVAVAWLATVTTAAIIAISLPGHVVMHTRAGLTPNRRGDASGDRVRSAHRDASAARGPRRSSRRVPAAAAIPVGSLPVAASAPALSPLAFAASAGPTSAPPAPAVRASALPASTLVSPKRTAPKPAPGRSAGVTSAAPAARARPVQVTAATSSPSAPAIAAAPRPSPPARSAPASTAGMSLDELIRHEVQVESAKHK